MEKGIFVLTLGGMILLYVMPLTHGMEQDYKREECYAFITGVGFGSS
jgi:hypothetical protein